MNTPGRIKFSQLPVLSEVDDSDEVLFRDVDGEDPAQQVGRLSIATLRAAMGGGADDWSEFPATSSVDMDGHGLTNLPAPSAASDAATKGYVDARPGAEKWSEHAATQDVDLDGHKITGLGEPTDASDAATKGYVDSAAPAKIERTFSWGRSVAEVTDDGDIDLSIYLTGQTAPLRRVRLDRGSGGGWIVVVNRSGMGPDAWVNTLQMTDHPTPGLMYQLSGGGGVGGTYRGNVTLSHGRWSFGERGGSAVYLGSEGYYALPSGVSSIKHGIHLAKEAYDTLASMPAPPELEWWEPVWTPVANVDSVSNVECQYTRTYRAAGGSLVTLEGTIEVTPEAAGQCAVQANLPIARDGSGLLAGTAMAMEVTPPGHVVAVASVGSTTLTLGFDAEGVDPYLVGFRASYRAA